MALYKDLFLSGLGSIHHFVGGKTRFSYQEFGCQSLWFFYHFKLLLWIENQTAEINTAPVYFHCQVYMTKVTGEDIFKACTNVRILGEDLLPVSFSRGVRRFLHWVDLKASDCWGGREVGEWDNSHTVPLPYLLGPQSLQGLSVPALPVFP